MILFFQKYKFLNVHFSESSEWQLDEILEELSALENQLNSANGDQVKIGIA